MEVLDFGFRELKSIKDFSENTNPLNEKTKYRKNKDGKYVSNQSLRFRSNEIVSLDGLQETFSGLLGNFI
jgi:hypothetical protein